VNTGQVMFSEEIYYYWHPNSVDKIVGKTSFFFAFFTALSLIFKRIWCPRYTLNMTGDAQSFWYKKCKLLNLRWILVKLCSVKKSIITDTLIQLTKSLVKHRFYCILYCIIIYFYKNLMSKIQFKHDWWCTKLLI